MLHSTVTTKGQTTIPEKIRKALRIKAGDKLDYEVEGELGESGLVVRVQLRGLQPDPYPETAGAERVKQRPRPSVAADGGRAESKTIKRAAHNIIHTPRKTIFSTSSEVLAL
jgi:AbrB family looped-hinge helix DNA binding protein